MVTFPHYGLLINIIKRSLKFHICPFKVYTNVETVYFISNTVVCKCNGGSAPFSFFDNIIYLGGVLDSIEENVPLHNMNHASSRF